MLDITRFFCDFFGERKLIYEASFPAQSAPNVLVGAFPLMDIFYKEIASRKECCFSNFSNDESMCCRIFSAYE